MSDMSLNREFVERLRTRADDPARRSDQVSLQANSVPMGDLLAGLPRIEDPEIQARVDGLQNMLSRVMGMFGSGAAPGVAVMGPGAGGPGGLMSIGGSTQPSPVPPPCSEARIETTEAALGFALPSALRQLYVEIGDGGFGPGNGLYGLDALVAKWRELTSEPVGPQGQDWPAHLLPITGDNWDLVCLDRESGRLLFWDVEELADDEEEDPGNAAWTHSFKPESDSLRAWLASWLERPTQAEAIGAARF